MATEAYSAEQVHQDIKKRLLENGEWERCVCVCACLGLVTRWIRSDGRISAALEDHLRESGWMDDVKDLAKGELILLLEGQWVELMCRAGEEAGRSEHRWVA